MSLLSQLWYIAYHAYCIYGPFLTIKKFPRDTFFTQFVLSHASDNIRPTSPNIGGTDTWAIPPSQILEERPPVPLILRPWRHVWNMCKNMCSRKMYVRSKFSCVRSSHRLCAHAHAHSLEGALVKSDSDRTRDMYHRKEQRQKHVTTRLLRRVTTDSAAV